MQALAVLGDETRRRIVELLAEQDLPAGEIASRFATTRPAVSRHLRVLREAGLVTSRVHGQQRIYRFDPAGLEEVDAWLRRCRGFWNQRLDAFATEASRGKRAHD